MKFQNRIWFSVYQLLLFNQNYQFFDQIAIYLNIRNMFLKLWTWYFIFRKKKIFLKMSQIFFQNIAEYHHIVNVNLYVRKFFENIIYFALHISRKISAFHYCYVLLFDFLWMIIVNLCLFFIFICYWWEKIAQFMIEINLQFWTNKMMFDCNNIKYESNFDILFKYFMFIITWFFRNNVFFWWIDNMSYYKHWKNVKNWFCYLF